MLTAWTKIVAVTRAHPNATLKVRRFIEPDFQYLVSRWHETNLVSYPYSVTHQGHSLQDALDFFRGHVMTKCELWVAELGRSVGGLIALHGSWIDQLAIFPEYQRRGLGTALLNKAQQRSPEELCAYAFQRNNPARAFYEHHGFVAVTFGVSPRPESEPDVKYRWADVSRLKSARSSP